ncbi:MAG: N-acetyl-gamma-glutamyl-phosphate reductase [Bdellovibrionaceae bacterium]|nr:N-acetyl-gamma-glutamyl-phosphate reductase [Bdellovibrio sp.]
MNGKNNKKKITCCIVGARGYAGLELARLLLRHPNVDLKFCFATSEMNLSHYLNTESAKNVVCLLDKEIMSHLTDVVFLATPAEVSLKLAPQILASGKKVIDLSGAFRLKENDYQKWYGFEHTEPTLLANALYGLLPWVGPSKNENLVANPGCFATAVTLALIPLLKDFVIDSENIVIDAKSGSTGGGKKAAENLLFTEVDGECLPYKVGRHQHYPEIVEAIKNFSGQKIEAHFTTSLLPVRRGIIAGVYGRLAAGKTIEDVENAFQKYYGDYTLVNHGRLSSAIAKSNALLSLKKVVGTAKTHISYEVEGNKLYLFSCIDNLLKGAASQAVENLNRIADLPLTTAVNRMEALI